MNYSTYRFSLDVNSTQAQVSIPTPLGDTGRVWCISLTNGGTPYTIEDGCLAMVSIKRPTGTHFEAFCIIENNTTIKYSFAQNENTAVAEGIHDCQVTLYDAEGTKITSPRFSMVVSDRVVNSDDINITDEDMSVVDNMIAREAARSAAEEARVSAESARVDAESVRVAAETTRNQAMDDAVKKSNEAYQTANNTMAALERKVAAGDFDGAPGTSATHSWDGTVLTITSASGTSSQELKGEKGDRGERGFQGERGPAGQGFSISKTYASVEQMNAGFESDDVPLNGFVLIDTGNINDEDNAKLFVKLESGYSYLTDLSGSQGIKGEKGESYVLTEEDKAAIVDKVVPTVSEDFGTRLTAVEGKIEDIDDKLKNPTSTLPAVTESDNGKVLSVVGGAWAAAEAVSGEIPFFDLAEMGLPEVPSNGTTANLTVDTTEIKSALDNGCVKFAVNAEDTGRVEIVMNKYSVDAYGIYLCLYNTPDGAFMLMIADGAIQASIIPLSSLPAVSETDNGKVLGVSGGTWTPITPAAGGVASWNDLTDKPFGDNADGTVTQLDNKYLAIFDHQAASQTDILPETSVSFVSGEGAPEAVAVLADGETYHVAWNGTVYVLTAKGVVFDGIAGIAIGNTSIIGAGDDTGEPFVLGYAPDYDMNVFVTQAAEDATHNVRIYQSTEETYTVKEKNLPMDIIRRVVDDYINEALGGDY